MGNIGERKKRTRRSILEGAHRLFAAAGYEATSIEQVMRECDLTHGGFYAHFRSKLELYREAMCHALESGWPWADVPPLGGGETIATLLRSPALAFLAADMAHEDAEVREICAQALDRLADSMLGERASDGARLSLAAVVVGALTVARSSTDRSFRASLASSCESTAQALFGASLAAPAPAYFWEPPSG